MQSIKMSRCVLKLLQTQKKAMDKLLEATEEEHKIRLVNVLVAINIRINNITRSNTKNLKPEDTVCWICRSLLTKDNHCIEVEFNGRKENAAVCHCCYEAKQQLGL